jgi:hypothetical protein
MFGQLLSGEDDDGGYVDFANATEIVVLVNNLGSLSVLELSGITAQVVWKLGTCPIFVPIPCEKAKGELMSFRISRHQARENLQWDLHDESQWPWFEHHSAESRSGDVSMP